MTPRGSWLAAELPCLSLIGECIEAKSFPGTGGCAGLPAELPGQASATDEPGEKGGGDDGKEGS
jgi:hypothetical protein